MDLFVKRYYLLKDILNIHSFLKDFSSMVKTQFQKTVYKKRSDNGIKFVNKSCIMFFKENGIIHQKTCPYTLQQNGIVERKYKHLLQVARSLMFQSNLPKMFWGESFFTSHTYHKYVT